jgi:hypothetical protein
MFFDVKISIQVDYIRVLVKEQFFGIRHFGVVFFIVFFPQYDHENLGPAASQAC